MKKKLALSLACLLAVSAASVFTACGPEENPDDGVVKYSVVFETLGGSSVAPLSLAEGDTITRPSTIPTKEMFAFDDWYTDKTFTEKYVFGGKMPAYNIIVYAGWAPESSVEIKYNANGGAFGDGSVEIVEYGNVGAPFVLTEKTVSLEGYVFGGWYADKECTQEFIASIYPVEGLTLYARWNNDPNYAYISYYGNGELIAKVPVKKGTQISDPELWDDDIVSTGWYTNEQMTESYTFGTAQNDLPLYTTYYTAGLKFNGNTVIGYDGSARDVVVPNKYNGVNITHIGNQAFYRSSELTAITSVSLPDTVNVIQNGAFYDCRYLVNVRFSSNVTDIGDNAFCNNVRLKTVGDMSGVVRIGEAAFAGCKEMRSIEVPSRLSFLGNYAFANCAMLEQITLPESLGEISDYTFSGCKSLKKVEVNSASLGAIGIYSFENCTALEQVTLLSNSVPALRAVSGVSPFADCGKVKIHVPASALDVYKAQFGHLDDGMLENKFVAIG